MTQLIAGTNIPVPTVAETKTWLQKHENIIIAVFVLAVVLFLGNKWLGKSAADADAKAKQAQAVLVQQQQANAELLAEMKTADANYKASVDAMEKQYAGIISAIAQRQTILVQQQKADAAMSPSDLTKRWAGLVNVSTSDIETNSIDYTVTDNAARKTVSSLEEIPVLQQDKIDLQTAVADKQKEIDSCNTDLDKTKATVVGLQNAAKDQTNACNAQVSAIKKVDRAAKVKWFLYGYGAGFISGVVTTAVAISHL